MCSTLYLSDEERRANPTRWRELCGIKFCVPVIWVSSLCDRLPMRKTARVFFLLVLGMLSTAVLGAVTALMVAVSLAATTALVVPGTGTPDANDVTNYLQNARDRYMAPFTSCTEDNDCEPTGVDYPASFWPLGFIGNWCPGFQCDTWNESVGTGVANLDDQLRGLLAGPDDIVMFGYSQGGAVVSNELRNLGDLTPEERARLSVVMIGNAYNPDGGIFTRLGFLPTIPFLNVTFGPKMPTDTGIPITSIGFEYDPVMYAPLYWGNPFSFWNALAAFDTVHGYYLTPNGNGPTDPIAYGYTEPELAAILAGPCPGPNCRVDANGNKYYMIPAKSLPIVDAVMGWVPAPLKPVAKPVADLVSPVLKVLIDLGYDWTGDPGQERWLSLLPFNPIQNWPAVGVNLVAATIQGIQAFISDLGGLTSTIAPATTAPTPVSTLAAARVSTSAETTDEVSETKQSTPKLTVVKDSETEVHQTAVQTEMPKDEQPAAKPEETTTKPESTTDDKTSDETKADETKADETTADNEKADDKKTDAKADTEKKSDNDKKSESDKKDADSAKAAA